MNQNAYNRETVLQGMVDNTKWKTVATIQQGWVLQIPSEEDLNPELPPSKYRIANLTEDGIPRFYLVGAGQYSPVVFEEPLLALKPPPLAYVNGLGEETSPVMPLKGIIVKESQGVGGKVLYRGNLTNFLGRDQGSFGEDGSITVPAGTFHLQRLVAENRNRIVGYIGFYGKEKPAKVQVLEVEDLG